MTEKKEKCLRKPVTDLGIAAFVSMHGYKCCGKRGKVVFFEIETSQENEFDKLCFEYFNSACATFDDHLMKLKKLGDYVSPESN